MDKELEEMYKKCLKGKATSKSYDGNKRTALYWIYKLTHDDYDKFDEYTFKGIIEALGDK